MFLDLVSDGGIDVLERSIQFASARQRIIAHNIANISTPHFRPADVSVPDFQQALAKAIDDRRATHPGVRSVTPFQPGDTKEVRFRPDRLDLSPRPTGEGILFHDRNDRDLEGLMRDLTENTFAHRTAIELLRARFAVLQTAIRERI